MDIQEAYKIFGLSDNATDEEIENQYLKWIRRHKATHSSPKADQSPNMESINIAYKTIKTYKKYGSESQIESVSFRKKIEHFFHYYKLHTIGIIALIVIVIGIIQTVVDARQAQKELANLPPENVNIMYFGSYFHSSLTSNEEQENVLAENVLTHFPAWERVVTTLNYSPLELKDGSDIGLQQKSAVVIATEKPDMYIMDLEFFQVYVNSGMFHPLEQLDLPFEDKSMEDKLYYAKAESDTTEHLYGVEITDDSIFDGLPVSEEKKKIAAIRKDANNKDNAAQLILKFSNSKE